MAKLSTTRVHPVPPAKLWFGFTATAAAWIALGSVYTWITWWACVPEGILSTGKVRSGVGLLYFSAGFLLIGAAVFAGILSYRNWRQLSTARSLSDAQAEGRPEFMALTGLFVSLTLGVGLLWLTIPLLIISLCVRMR